MEHDPDGFALVNHATRMCIRNARLKEHAEAMAKVLNWLDALGGLGFDKHGEIERALKAYRADFQKD